jgi:glycosyltransferase involved in cell wall biosynthesis
VTALRVAIDATAVPAEARGAGRYVLDLAAALDRRDDVGLTVVAGRGDAARWPDPVVAKAPLRRPLRLVWEQLALPRLLRRLDVDVHHGPHYTMPERARLPRVVTVHDLTFFDHPEWHERVKVPFFRRAIRVAARRADAIVCPSRFTAHRLQAVCSPACPVEVIAHGVDHARFRPDGPAWEGSGPYVLFVGTIEPRKDVPGLVRAFDRTVGDHPYTRLVLAGGRGWGWPAAEAAIAASRHRDRIDVLGFVPNERVPALLRGAAAVAYPSLEEGFGLPALEALACGAPLVTTSGTAMAEVTGDAALLVPPGDTAELAGALDRILAGDPDQPRRRAAGLARAAAATWDAAAEQHAAVYRSAVAGRR